MRVRAWVGIVTAVGAALVFQFRGATPTAAKAPAAHGHAAISLLAIINHDRAAAGLRPLTFDDRLAAVARGHSDDMARRGYFSHYTPSGKSPFDRMRAGGVRYAMAGENLGMDSGESQHAMLLAIDSAMLRSPEHRANLLRPGFTRVGIGIARSGATLYVTEDFTG